MPATATTARACCTVSRLSKSRCSPRHTDVCQTIHAATHEFRREACLGGHRQVGGARRHDGDPALRKTPHLAANDDGAGVFMVLGSRNPRPHRRVEFRRRPRRENRLIVRQQLLGNGGDLCRGLPRTEDHFREADPQLALRINLGKAEILVGSQANTAHDLLDIYCAALQVRQQFTQCVRVHWVQ